MTSSGPLATRRGGTAPRRRGPPGASAPGRGRVAGAGMPGRDAAPGSRVPGRRGAAALLVVVLLLLTAGVVARGWGLDQALPGVDDGERGVLAVDPDAPQPATPRLPGQQPATAVVPAGGSWRWLPPAPVVPPDAHHGVWTGRDLLVVGADTAAAFDPAAERWRRLPPPPQRLPDRLRAVAWTGTELLVLGADLGDPAGIARGLALDPSSGTWRATAPPPMTGPVSVPAAEWTGEELVVWGLRATVAYDPVADRWRALPTPPVPPRLGGRMAWTGRYLVVWGDAVRLLQRQFAAAYDTVTDTWVRLPDPPLNRLAATPGVWTGEELVLVTPRTPPSFEHDRIALGGLRLQTDPWRWAPVPVPPWLTRASTVLTSTLAVTWTGDRVAALGDASFAGLHDPVAGTWTRLPRGAGDRIRPVLVWTGDRLLVWGGDGPAGPLVDLAAWQPAPAG